MKRAGGAVRSLITTDRRAVGGVVFATVALLFLIFVWPTPYEYHVVQERSRSSIIGGHAIAGSSYLVRVNRFTGATQRVYVP